MTAIHILQDIIQAEYRCEMCGLPGSSGLGMNGKAPEQINVSQEKAYQLKTGFQLEDDPDTDEFLGLYLDALRTCKSELERMDTMIDDFCTSYLDALKPNVAQQSPDVQLVGNQMSSWSENSGMIKRKADEGEFSIPMKKRRGNLPKAATNILKKWIFDHLFHPYPTEDEKGILSSQTGLSNNQIGNWFINARRRILQPMLENAQQRQGTAPGVDIPAQLPKKRTGQKQQSQLLMDSSNPPHNNEQSSMVGV